MRHERSAPSPRGGDVRSGGAASPRPNPIARWCPTPGVCLLALILPVVVARWQPGASRAGDGAPPPGPLTHQGRIEGVAYSPDGRVAASASREGTVRVWDVATHRPRGGARGIAGFADVAFSPDGRTLACAGLDGKVVLRDLARDRERRSIAACQGGSIRVVAFSPDGKSLATGGDDRTVRLWDLASGRERLAMGGHGAMVSGLAFGLDGLSLASVGIDGRAILWDLRTGRATGQVDGGVGPLRSVALAPDGRSLALGGRDGIAIRDLATGRTRGRTRARGEITDVCFLPSGSTLVSSSKRGQITLWDVADPGMGVLRDVDVREDCVNSLAISPDGTTLLTGSDHSHLKFWDLAPLIATDPSGARAASTGLEVGDRDGGRGTGDLAVGLES